MENHLSEYEIRKLKAKTLQENNITTYAPKFKKLQNIQTIMENHDARQNLGLLRNIEDIILNPVREISTAWRLTLYRSHGKISFWKLLDDSWEIQLMFHRDCCKMLKNRFPHKVNPEHHIYDPNKKELWRQVVKMIIIDDDGKIAVSHAASSNNYSLPWWWVDDGDSFYDAVHREAIEETWTAVKILYELPKIHEYLKKRDRHQLVYGFLCKTVGEKGEPEFVESEILDGFSVQWISLEELESHLQNQINNIENNPERSELDGIFQRDLILLQSAKKLLQQTTKRENHEWYGQITEISDDIIINWEDINPYKFLEKYIDVWDIIWIKWEIFTTHKWEATIFVSEFQLLSKAIRPLWDKFHGIGEWQETAYRQRYLDMIFNRDTLERMKLRSQFLQVIRQFYRDRGFIEVETPVLWNSASGAAARPFITHHNDFDTDMYLRISPETSLKKITVGMFEKIFEVAKDFRNEGSDPSHHQEFTMIEHYAAYRNHEDNMAFTEAMFDYIFTQLPALKKVISVTDKNGVTKEVNFQTPWPRIDYIAQIKKDSGIDVSTYMDGDEDKLRNDIKSAGHTREWIETQGLTTMIDYLYKKVTRPKIVWPAFIVNYPKLMQPLARISDQNSNIVEQRQLLINGREVIKAYSELVDPVQQQENFDAQASALAAWDEEATSGDPDFVQAMEYGMPPQSGRGMGIDRIFALLTEQENIRDVILFPLMKLDNKTSKED